MDFQDELTDFYARYNVELIRAPEGFFTYAPVQRRLFLVQCFLKWICWSAKFFCYLYLSPERLANQDLHCTRII